MFCKVSLMNHFAEAPSLFDDYDLQVIERPVPTIVDGHRQRLRDRFTTCGATDLCPKFPPALRGVLGVKSLALGRHLVHRLSLQKFHRCQVAQC